MKRTLFVHAGLHKTGTTSAQFSLHGYEDDSVRYFPLELPNHSAELVSMFLRPDDARKFFAHPARRYVKRYEARRDDLLRHFDQVVRSNDRSSILSAEVLTYEFSKPDIERLLERARPGFDEIRALIYVRPPASLTISSVQERLKSGEEFNLELAYPNYQRRISPWIELLGIDNVQFTDITSDRLTGGSVVADLRSRTGVVSARESNDRRNVSLSAEATALSTLFRRRLSDGSSPWSRVVVAAALRRVRDYGGRRFGIEPRLLEAILDENSDDVEWMEDLLGHRFEPHLQPADAVLFSNDADVVSFAERHEPEFRRHVRRSVDLRRDLRIVASVLKVSVQRRV